MIFVDKITGQDIIVNTDPYTYFTVFDDAMVSRTPEQRDSQEHIYRSNLDNLTGLFVDGVQYGSQECLEGTIKNVDIIRIYGNDGCKLTCIETNAMAACTSLKEVQIPNGVQTIGNNAFIHCENLHFVDCPSTLKTICSDAFAYCYELADINMRDGVESIGERAFMCCFNLSSINIPDTVAYIGDSAFSSCSSLVSITIPNVEHIGSGLFEQCYRLKTINFRGMTKEQVMDIYDTLSIPEGCVVHCSDGDIIQDDNQDDDNQDQEYSGWRYQSEEGEFNLEWSEVEQRWEIVDGPPLCLKYIGNGRWAYGEKYSPQDQWFIEESGNTVASLFGGKFTYIGDQPITPNEPDTPSTPDEDNVKPLYFKNESGTKFYQVIVTEDPNEPLDVVEVTETDGKDFTNSVDAYVMKDLATNEYYALYVSDVDGNISLEIYGPGNPSEGDVVVDVIDFSSNGQNYRLEYKNHNINITKSE